MNNEVRMLMGKDRYDISDLIKIMELLRRDDGCPWDKVQTHESIRGNLIEETYEAVEAIDNNDSNLLCEELGDILLQVVFHSRMSEESGEFSFSDVADGICKKLIVRHPHIFSDVSVDGVGDVLKNWDQIKRETKHQKSVSEEMDSVARSLPALIRAEKIAGKEDKASAKRARLDDRVKEISHTVKEIEMLDIEKKDSEKNCECFTDKNGIKADELVGKLLYNVSALSYTAGIDAEKSLYDECESIIKSKSGKKDINV